MTVAPIHVGLANGRWYELSLCEQLGNVGSEIHRALAARSAGDTERESSALDRALELMDLTIADPKNQRRLRELCRAREVVCDFFFGDNGYQSTDESLNRYFFAFATTARYRKNL